MIPLLLNSEWLWRSHACLYFTGKKTSLCGFDQPGSLRKTLDCVGHWAPHGMTFCSNLSCIRWCNPDMIIKQAMRKTRRILIWHTHPPQYPPSLSPLPSLLSRTHSRNISTYGRDTLFFTSVKQIPTCPSGISKPAYVFVVFYLNYYCFTDWTVYY